MFYTGVWIEDKRSWGPALPNREETAPFGSYDRVYRDPLEAAAKALRERGLNHGTIGLELRFLGVTPYRYLKSLLPEARFADALPLMNELRVIEDGLKKCGGCALLPRRPNRRPKSLLRRWRRVATGLDLERVIGASHYRAGVRHEWCHTCIGPRGAHIDCPNDTPVHPGDVIRLDVGSSYRHYQSDVSRVGVLGEPSAELLKVHGAMRKALEAVIEAARPGVSAEHLYEVGNSIVEREGFDNYLTVVGHGLGRDVHEIPFLQRGELRLLEPGMTFSIELVTTLSGLGCIALEDEIVIMLMAANL